MLSRQFGSKPDRAGSLARLRPEARRSRAERVPSPQRRCPGETDRPALRAPPHHRRAHEPVRLHRAARHADDRGRGDQPRVGPRATEPGDCPRQTRSATTPCLPRWLPRRSGSIRTLNARWEADGIHLLAEVNIALAVDTERGLMTPVLAGRRPAEPAGRAGRFRCARVSGAGRQVAARRLRRRHLHHHEPGRQRHRRLHADHQPAAGRDPGCGPDRREAGGARRRSGHSPDGDPEPELRPPHRRRRARGQVPAADQAAGRKADGACSL